MKRIKENISSRQFSVLMAHLKGDSKIRQNRKDRLLIIFNLLYATGIRVNECTQFTDTQLKQLIETKSTIIKTPKTQKERVLYITDNTQKQFRKQFIYIEATDTKLVQSERVTKELNVNSVIFDVNSYLKVVFGANTRITSHSFRQTLITELATAGINATVIQNFIGHSNVITTLRYVKPSQVDISSSVIGIR